MAFHTELQPVAQFILANLDDRKHTSPVIVHGAIVHA